MEIDSLVMAPVPGDDLYLVSKVQKVDGNTVTVITSKGQELAIPVKDVIPVHDTDIQSTDDMTKLENLQAPLIIHNLRQRYHKGIIYTYIGPMVISVNPYRVIQELGSHLIPEYQQKDRDELPPHLYSMAQKAYKSMLDFGNSQSIVIIGESGAGKTEATKIVLNFLTVASEKALNSQIDIAEMILATNPLLEAFGNAKTIRNDNSSRFGKFIKVLFQGPRIVGATIDNYLLEKTRVVYQAPNERSYHIFYQLINGTTPEEKVKYRILEEESKYRYLTHGRVKVQKDDVKGWRDTKIAFKVLGFTETEIDSVLYLLSAILRLGNIEFVATSEENAKIKDESALTSFCDLIGLTPMFGIAKKSFLSRTVQVVGRNSVSYVPLTATQAAENRDALAKKLYNELFNWLVQKLNTNLKQQGSSDTRFIGVLDIYGFEIFENNSLEQFCINYANEKLHYQFTQHMFKSEQEEYQQEGVNWKKVDFKDNSGCISLIEKNRGIIEFIQEQCKIQNSSDSALIEQLKKNIKNNIWFEPGHPSDPQDQFGIKHFAGTVTYSTRGFIDKNKDTLNTDMEVLIKKSTLPIISFFFTDIDAPPAEEKKSESEPEPLSSPRGNITPRFSQRNNNVLSPTRNQPLARQSRTLSTANGVIALSRDKKTVTVRFREELGKLIDMLSASDRHYVRCIKPNEEKSDKIFETEKVRLQLLCNGIFETVAIRKAGFSMRLQFERFFDKYWAILDHRSKDGIEDLLNKLMPDTNQWCLGKQKVFLREPTVELLSATLTKKWEKNAIPIQNHIRRYHVQVSYITQLSIRSVQSHIRKHRAILRLQELRDIYNAATRIQSFVSRLRAFEEYLELKRAWEERVTTSVQAHIRKYTAVLLLQELRDMWNAATRIQSFVSRLLAFEVYLELKRAWEERVRCTIIVQSYIRKSKATRILGELESRKNRANLRASQFKDYYDCTRININPGLKLNTSILQQSWAHPTEDEQNDVIVVVYTPRH